MRIIGEINHLKYKITAFQLGEKISLQISDGLVELTVKFRDGMRVNNIEDLKKYLDNDTMLSYEKQLNHLSEIHRLRLHKLLSEEEGLPHIV